MIVWPLLDLRFACEKCQNGHRNGSCAHTDRKLLEIRAKGRPTTQCNHCRSKRKEGIGHSHHKCMCGDGLSAVKKKVEVFFEPNIVLVFTPEKSDVHGLRKLLEESPRTFLSVSKKAKPGKGGADTATQVEITYVKTEVVEETISVDMQRILANPCRCQYGGSCVCSELPPAKPCGSKSKRSASATPPAGASPTASPAIAPALLSSLVAGFPRPIDLGLANFNIPPLPTGPQAFYNASTYQTLPGQQPILPMPSAYGSLPPQMQQPYTQAPQAQSNLADTRGHDPAVLQALIALQQSGQQPTTGQHMQIGNSTSVGGCGCGSKVSGGCGCGTGCGCGGKNTAAAAASRSRPASSCCGGGGGAPEPVEVVKSSCCAPAPVQPAVAAAGCCGSRPAAPLPPPPPVAACCGGGREASPAVTSCGANGGMVASSCCGPSAAGRTAGSSCGCAGAAKASTGSSCCGGGGSSASGCGCSGNSSGDDVSLSSRRGSSGCGCGGGGDTPAARRASQGSCCGGGAASTAVAVTTGGCGCNSRAAPVVPASSGGGCCGPKPVVTKASCCGGGGGGSVASFSQPPQQLSNTPMQLDDAGSTNGTCDCGCHESKAMCGDCVDDLCPVVLLGSDPVNTNQQTTAAMLDELDQLSSANYQDPRMQMSNSGMDYQQQQQQQGIVRSTSCVAIDDPFNMTGMRNALCGCGCSGGGEGRPCQCG
ncbi:hypothetical protein HDU88_008291 [Geranomyces variabilis]|nr:hypothetical protein HDU88_008291 [Geranomyces variabilis]